MTTRERAVEAGEPKQLRSFWVDVEGLGSRWTSGFSHGQVRFRIARDLEELGYYPSIGAALKAIRVIVAPKQD